MLRLKVVSLLFLSQLSVIGHVFANEPSIIRYAGGKIERSLSDMKGTLKNRVSEEPDVLNSSIAITASSFKRKQDEPMILSLYSPRATRKRELKNNLVLYWGQGDHVEKPLSYYCDQSGVSMICLDSLRTTRVAPKNRLC